MSRYKAWKPGVPANRVPSSDDFSGVDTGPDEPGAA